MILRRTDRDGARAVAHHEKRHFGSGQALFDHEPIAGRAERPRAHRRDGRRLRGCAVLGDDDAFAGGQAVGLQHDGETEPAIADHRERFVEGLARLKTRGRDGVACHEGFRKRLAGLEPGGGGGRPEQQSTFRGKAIGHAEAEGELRSDDGEVDVFAVRQVGDGVEVGEVDGKGARKTGDAGITRGADQFADVAVGCETGDEGVLARAATKNKNSHCLNGLRRATRLTSAPRGRDYFVDLGGDCT